MNAAGRGGPTGRTTCAGDAPGRWGVAATLNQNDMGGTAMNDGADEAMRMRDGLLRAPARRLLRGVSVSQRIHASLRERIVSLELAPGQNLSRAEIAERYGVSQTPVRDAMMKLEEEDLLVIFPQSRTEVSRIDVAQARETQFLRMSVEIEVAKRLAASGERSLTAPAEMALSRQRAALAAGDLEGFTQLDRAFHRALHVAAGVGALWELVTGRSGHIDRLRALNLPDPGKAAEILGYHAAILAAIGAGDAAEAEEQVRAHLSGTLAQAAQIMARHPRFF